MINAGIIGGSGYTAGELLRLLANHPHVNIDFVYSTTNAGKPVTSVHQDLLGDVNINFTENVNPDVDVVFLCLGHGQSKAFLTAHNFSANARIIDLGNDFRLDKDANFDEKQFVYGLPELNRKAITEAKYIANPGCFATAIQLALLPLAQKRLLQNDVHINATTGSTGAGVQPSATSHHPWRTNNMSHYKAFEHQHLGEIGESLKQLQSGFEGELLFIPNRGDFTRGIFATLYTKLSADFKEVVSLYNDYYKDEPFVNVTTDSISLKLAVQTNKCFISLEQKGGYVLITSVIDNLIKGASGQAIENMNLMFELEEATGLRLKPAGF
ncbi:N-acetyl-gamma-glutamyl-phosphate reductase [Flavobacterium sp. DG1-102-2]|uniref:N-acetyl-gamma-glutamyl-phosphate reductase n=1 Tax=Flavobacterium sp. DG1-102-2 TaxID=3081663 RepID=UPI00294A0F5A|nr:N-acetyl-gamma-glutamyl-phosphate reductase [Flavobacterium sp. DG1-102-2]MDV6167505.1 N-acetyl-gamma-glutamyl-phosphate reductase [Flavobacterium sp. DG1-102-2]